jgi:Ca2+-binding RTX toxin-like protein
VVIGNTGGDTLSGGRGDDTIHGDSGNDKLFGNQGVDALFGGDGSDDLWALAGADVALPGADSLTGGAGNDKFHARDGEPDVVDCGSGKDSAQLDLVDTIADATPARPKGACETVQRAQPKTGQDNPENKTESPSEDALQA